jgi:hypothetical protein
MKSNEKKAKSRMRSDYNERLQWVAETEMKLSETDAIIDYVLAEFDAAVDQLRNEYETTYLRRHCN